ncbi:MAG TPA: response regulator, partial [Candidatus Omnitrophota bacterium]|nr:response regulator [Candidatus Omnitrophota bacterium]
TLRGIDLIKAIRAIRPELPCLLCSGYAEELNEAACKDSGVGEMLRKPVGFSEMIAAIERNLTPVTTNG